MQTPIKFEPNPKSYRKLYNSLKYFLNADLESLSVNDEGRITNANGEYKFTSEEGKTLIQNDKIGKIGEYAFHLIMTGYYKVNCIIPKFTLTTSRNMSVFGIDALFYNMEDNLLYFGESKVSESIVGAIKLINESFKEYEKQMIEEYRLVLSDTDKYKLSKEYLEAFGQYSDICISFKEFIEKASIKKICIPAFLAHGNSKEYFCPESFLEKMNTDIKRNQLFNLETEYIFISLPLINKAKMVETFMKKVVKKNNEYQRKFENM